MSATPPEAEGPSSSSGPLLGLLSRALELWLRQQCQTIGRLEVQLQGSARDLLRGRLAGVSLEARRVDFRHLRLEQVSLSSGPIRVRMGPLLRQQSFQLEQDFRVLGSVTFSAEDLGRSLATAQWRSLGDGLAEEFLGLTPLAGLRIADGRLVLIATGAASEEPLEVATELEAVEGTIELRSERGDVVSRLPMDEAIRIERASLSSGLLVLEGEARVSP